MSPEDAGWHAEDRKTDDGCPGPELSGSGLIATSGEVAKTPARRPALGAKIADGRRPQTAGDRTAEDRQETDGRRPQNGEDHRMVARVLSWDPG